MEEKGKAGEGGMNGGEREGRRMEGGRKESEEWRVKGKSGKRGKKKRGGWEKERGDGTTKE